MATSESQDGPDGLHRLHRLLTASFGVEIPASDYGAAIILLDNLGVSVRGIEELMGRFSRNLRGQIKNNINDIITGKRMVEEEDVSRVKQLLIAHGYDTFTNISSPEWAAEIRELDPQNPSIPILLRPRWRSLLHVF